MSGVDPGTLLSVGTTLAGGVSQRSSAYKAAAVDDENARLSILQGELDAGDVARQARRDTGAALASLAGSGVMIGEGTAATIIEQSLLQRELDVQRIRQTAEGEARNYRNRAADTRAAGRSAMTGSIFSAVTGVVSDQMKRRNRRRVEDARQKERGTRLGLPGGNGNG